MTDPAIDLFAFRPDTPLRETADGPLAGMGLVIRPDICLTGWLTDAGSRALAGFEAVSDATVITRLKGAGAAFTGSARMAELGFGLRGDTMAAVLSNTSAPVSATALAPAEFVDPAQAGLMNDIMGEARMAACIAGCYGFKPSYGLLSRAGLVGLVPSMESPGVLARNPSDIARLLSVMAGPDENDSAMCSKPPPDFNHPAAGSPGPVRIGVCRRLRDQLDSTTAVSFTASLKTLTASGFDIHEISLPASDQISLAHQVIAAVEASSAAGKYDGVRFGFRAEGAGNWNEMYLKTRAEGFGYLIKSLLFQGACFQFQNYAAFEKACSLRRRLVNEIEALFGKVDLLVLPTRPGRPDPRQADTLQDTWAAFGLTLVANLAGLPALQIPGSGPEAAVDAGLQLIGPRLSDALVLAAGLKISTRLQGDAPA